MFTVIFCFYDYEKVTVFAESPINYKITSSIMILIVIGIIICDIIAYLRDPSVVKVGAYLIHLRLFIVGYFHVLEWERFNSAEKFDPVQFGSLFTRMNIHM